MASPQSSRNHHTNFRRAFALTPALALAALMVVAAVWGASLTSAARSEPEKLNARLRGELAPEARMMSAPVPFATITVDRTDDNAAASLCTAAANDCSLRGAVTFANLNPGTTISVPAGTYNLTIPGAAEGFTGNNAIGDLDIRGNNTTIVGSGAATTIINQTINGHRVIEVNPLLNTNFTASISDVTISGGRETTGVGGGGLVGGSIGNSLTLTNCVFSGNSATGAGTFGGGGISYTGGSLTITGCTFSGNTTSASGGGIGYSAGDPSARTPSVGILTITGSTFINNTANSTAAGGGALDLFNFNSGSGSYSVSSSTFSGNRAANGNGGAIIVESGGPTVVTTSAFVNNFARTSGGAVYGTGTTTVQFSRLVGNSVTTATNGLTLFRRTGVFTGNDNWWGVNTGPSANDFRGFGGVTITPITFLQLQATASPSTVCTGATSTINADIKKRNAGPDLTVELNGLPDFPATFVNTTPALGTLSGASANYVNGAASATFTAGATSGTASIDATADNQTATASVVVQTNDTTDPADQAVCEGASATFSTTASGPGPISFVWKQGATVLNNGDLGGRVVIVSAGSHSSLTITGVQPGDAATYTVEATGACSTTTQSATLTVNAATTASDPADQTVCQGASASFSTTAGGSGPFSYAWTVDGSAFGGNTSSISVPTGSLSLGNHTVSVTVTGACGSASQSASLTVQENTATTDPADQTVCQGASASFSTTASGTAISYAWTVDGSPFGGNTSSITVPTGSLSIGGHTVGLTVSGTCGTVSQSASLTVQENTTTTDPADQTVCQGASASFSTTAGGTGPFTYAWTVDGSPAGSTSSITVATGSLSVGSHTVSVTTTGTCGSASQSATLTVQENTSTTDPADQTVCQGANASFSTTASGTGPFSYAWTVDGSPFGGNTSSISVPTGSLTLGNHTVSVTTTGTCGSASQTATLTVQENTTTTDPADQTVCQGATASFSTTAGGTGPFSYAWTLDGSPFGGNTSSISVPTGSLTVGSHTVSVTTTGTCGSAAQSATLTVQQNTATSDPPDQTVCQGANATFSTTATGTGPFTYAWTLDGSPVGGNSASVSIPTGSLSAGNHTVSVTTSGTCGSASQSATLTVDTAPAVTLNPVSQSAPSGNVTFTAAASGSPAPTVQWQVSANGGATFTNIPGATSTSLTVTASPANNGYQYRAVFTNHCGTAITAAATLTTCNPPVITVGTNQLTMWPPDHKYTTFNISSFNISATSNCDGNITNKVVIASVTSDELDDNPSGGDGNTTNDIVIAANCKSVQLRSERDGNLDGRVYTITFKVTDANGQTTTATAKVIVPHNQGNGGAVDSGPHNTVNGGCP